MRSHLLLVIAFILTFTFPVIPQKAEVSKTKSEKPPSAAEIVDKYVEAIGGEEAIKKVKTRVATGTVELQPVNLKGTFEVYTAPEARYFSKMTIAGIGDLMEGIDGKSSWVINPIQGSRDRTGAELAQAKLINDFYRDVRLKKLFPKMELKGTEKLGEREAYVITATPEGGLSPETWYFEKETGLLLRSDLIAVTPEGNQPMSVYYEDHRTVDGIKIPFRVRTQLSGLEVILTSTEVKHNAAIDDAKFAKPKI